MTSSGRDAKGRYIRTVKGAERDAEACRLRAAGHSYQQIADRLGYGNRANARRSVERTIADTVAEPAAELRALELEHLDELRRMAWRVMHRPHLLVSGGKIVELEDTETGEKTPIGDDKPILEAIDRLLRISERRAKLLGLDAPTKVELGPEDLDAELARLAALVESEGRAPW